ncbi:MAG: hypothetical protein WD627_00335 [Actinomycetota bacterium]
MELTTWFPGYPQSLSQIRRLLRQLSSESSLPEDATEDLVLACSEAAGYLVGRTGVRELKLRWNSWYDGASVELEVDGIFPDSGNGHQPYGAFPIINAVVNQATVVENVIGRPRTTFKLVKYWQDQSPVGVSSPWVA